MVYSSTIAKTVLRKANSSLSSPSLYLPSDLRFNQRQLQLHPPPETTVGVLLVDLGPVSVSAGGRVQGNCDSPKKHQSFYLMYFFLPHKFKCKKKISFVNPQRPVHASCFYKKVTRRLMTQTKKNAPSSSITLVAPGKHPYCSLFSFRQSHPQTL